MFEERFRFFRAPEDGLKKTNQKEEKQIKHGPESEQKVAGIVSLEKHRAAKLKNEALEEIKKNLDDRKENSKELLEGIHAMCSDHYDDLVTAVLERHLKSTAKSGSLVEKVKQYITKRPPELQVVADRLAHVKDSVILSALRAISKIPLEQKVRGKKVFETAVLKIMVLEIEKRLPQEIVHLDSSERSALYDLGWSDEQVEAQADLLAGKNVLPLPQKEKSIITRVKLKKVPHLSGLEAANDDVLAEEPPPEPPRKLA